MILKASQARVIATLAERSEDEQVAVKVEAGTTGLDAVEVAIRPQTPSEFGVRDSGWKHFRVEPGGGTRLISS